MWRFQSVHEKSETEYLDDVVRRIEADENLSRRADALLKGASLSEPLIKDSLRTPQDIRYHAEGSTLHHHLRLMLMALYAIVDEKVHLIDIEEFRRLRGYEGEIDELEEILKEHVAFFEVFILCHDVAKWTTMFFTSREGSRGAEQGFHMEREFYFEHKHDERSQMRDKYLDLFESYKSEHLEESDREQQANFFLTYEIEVHYPHHARKVHSPVYASMLDRFSMAHELAPRHHDLLIDLIANHMDVIRDFRHVKPSRIGAYVRLAESRGWDADDYIDLMQGALLLDAVMGSKRLSPHGYWQDANPLIHCLRSEHDWAPQRRAEREAGREGEERRERNIAFKDAGLDGVALMDLLSMEAGKKFGITLRRIHASVLGQGDMPSFGKDIDREIQKRALTYYNQVFKKGE